MRRKKLGKRKYEGKCLSLVSCNRIDQHIQLQIVQGIMQGSFVLMIRGCYT